MNTLLRLPITLLATLCIANNALAQPTNPDFNVTVNPGPVAPNSDAVYPGEPTSLRITLSNNSTSTAITNAGFNIPLPTNANNGLRVNGASAINGDANCAGGSLVTSVGSAGITLSGLTVPARQNGVPGSGECYLDIPIVAYSNNGLSDSLSYAINTGDISADQGGNGSGGPQSITLLPSERPTWSKTISSDEVLVVGGATRTLRFTVNNQDNNVDLTGISFQDVFPTRGVDGAMMEPTGATSINCNGASDNSGAVITPVTGTAAQVDIDNLSIDAGDTCRVEVEIRARHNDSAYNRNTTNRLVASNFQSDQGLRPAADATRTIRVRSPLAVDKHFLPDIVASGEPNVFRVRLYNNGNTPLSVTSFEDSPIAAPPHNGRLMILSDGDISNDCGGNASLVDLGEGFSVDSFSIPANGRCEINVTYTGQTPGADSPTTYTNSISTGDVVLSGAPGIVNQSRTATVLVADRLRVRKAVTPANAAPGDAVRYAITIQNYSAVAVGPVSVNDTLQNGATYLTGGAYSPTLSAGCGVLGTGGAAQGDGSLTFTVPTVPGRTGANTPGACTISFSAMINPGASTNTTNTIGANAVCFGSPAMCNQAPSNEVSSNLVVPFAFAKTFDGVNAVVKTEGATTRLRLQLSNFASGALSNITFSDTFPIAGPFQQLRIANPANIANSCGGSITIPPDATSVALNGGSLPGGAHNTPATCELSVDVVGPAGVYPNSADMSAIRTNSDGQTSTLNSTDNATLTYTDALTAGKSFNPEIVGDNGLSTVRLSLGNLDTSRPITGIRLQDPLPTGMLIANPANAYSTCAGSPAISAAPGASLVELDGATLPPGGSCELLFDVIASGNSDWTNIIPAGGITADGGLLNRSPVSATLSYRMTPVPLISKSINPGTVVPGESALLTINLTNGSEALSNVSLSDIFTVDGIAGSAPNGMQVAPAPEAITNCPSGIVTATPGAAEVRLAGASLAPNASCNVQVQVTSTSVGTITNTIPLNSITSDQGATNSTTFAQSTLATTSEIGVGKTFTPPVVSLAEVSRLRVTIFNGRPESLTDFALLDTFPAGLELAPAPDPFSNCGGAVALSFPGNTAMQIDNGRIGPAQDDAASSCYAEVNVVASAEGSYINTIPANTLEVRGFPTNHPETSARLEVRQRIIVNKAIDNLTLDAGDPAGFTTGSATRLPGVPAQLTIRIENPNSIDLTAVALTDELPEGLVLHTTPAASTTCTDGTLVAQPSARELHLSGVTLASSSSCLVQVDVVSNIAGLYINEIPTGGVTSFEGVENELPTQAEILVSEPPSLSKDIAPPVVPPGVAATLTLVLGNNNSQDMVLSANLVDNLPATPGQMVVATPPNITSNCPGGAGGVTAAADSTTVTVSDGTVVPPGGCEITVDITAPVAGDYLNNIPVAALQSNFGPNDQPAEATLKVSTLGYISGRVFLDNQSVPTGVFLPGQSDPIAGNTVQLRSESDCSGALLASTTTDDQGRYLFAELSADTYSVCQVEQPSGTLNSITTEGTIVGVNGSGGTVGTPGNPGSGGFTSVITAIVLGNSGDADEVSGSPDNNFSEVLPASIAGNVYYDRNQDGVIDAGEDGIGAVEITLSGAVTRTTTTNPDGSYQFIGLPPGNYVVTETQPAGWSDTLDSPGSVGGSVRGATTSNDVLESIYLGPGDAGIEYNFGEYLEDLLVLDASPVCVNDAPYVNYEVSSAAGPFPPSTAPNVTITWLTEGGRVAERLENMPVSGTLLWPGATVNDAGMGSGWPGWVFENNRWVAVEDDRRPNMTVRVEINPSAEAEVTYPPATSACVTQSRTTYRSTEAIPATPVWALLIMILACMGLAARAATRSAMR